MRRLRALFMLAAVGCMLASLPGCASSGGSSGDYGDYYGRGTTHGDSFPATYGRTGYYRYGRPGRYRY
jgi:hypothetical protein